MLFALFAALVIVGWFAWKRNARFDLLDWALFAYAAAWLLAGLAAPWDFPAALRAALPLVGGALLCLCIRSALPPRDPRQARAWLAGTAVVAGVLAVILAGRPGSPVPRNELAAAARVAFSRHPVLGWGPGQFRQWTPRWLAKGTADLHADPPNLYLHHLADGGIVAAAALAFLVFFSLAILLPRIRGRRADPAARIGLAALILWLGWGLVANTLLASGAVLALMVALGLAAGKHA